MVFSASFIGTMIMQINGALEQYLKNEILPQVASPPYGIIEAVQISHQRPVYIYRDESSHARVVGKYYHFDSNNAEEAWHKAEKEYFNLTLLRDRLGMKDNHYNIVAPLGRNKVLSALLTTERAPGHTLDYYIARAIYENQTQDLFYRLGDLARFFVRLHRNSETGKAVSPQLPQWYLETILKKLSERLGGVYSQEKEIRELAAAWWKRDEMFSDHEVIVHGDATPTNFLFYHQKVTGIDLEKMKWADRCWDLGFMAAELKHHFMWRAGDDRRAEPFIGHFLWEYGLAFGDTGIFYRVTRRLPFYMALGLLRMARNDWLGEKYRYKLMGEAIQCLKYRP